MDGQERLSNTESWEEECEDAAERELNALEEKLAAEREENSQRIWLSFQNAANAVAQLFRGESVRGTELLRSYFFYVNFKKGLFSFLIRLCEFLFDIDHFRTGGKFKRIDPLDTISRNSKFGHDTLQR